MSGSSLVIITELRWSIIFNLCRLSSILSIWKMLPFIKTWEIKESPQCDVITCLICVLILRFISHKD